MFRFKINNFSVIKSLINQQQHLFQSKFTAFCNFCKHVCDCTHSTVTACLAGQRAQDFCVTMDCGSQPTMSSANSQRISNLMFEQFAQVLTLPDLSQFRFVFSGHYELAVFIFDRQAH